MTLEELAKYLERHTGYAFYSIKGWYSIYNRSGTFIGYLTEDSGKIYLWVVHDLIPNRITACLRVSSQCVLRYKYGGYCIHALYQLFVQ